MFESNTHWKLSRLLPFRFYSAYNSLQHTSSVGTRRVKDALIKAMDLSIENMPELKGNNAIVIDVSGSMADPISSKSSVSARVVSILLGAIVYKKSNGSVYIFGNNTVHIDDISTSSSLYDIMNKIYSKKTLCGGGTDLYKALQFVNAEYNSTKEKFDSVIILSDNDCYIRNGSSFYFRPTYGRSDSVDDYVNALIDRKSVV